MMVVRAILLLSLNVALWFPPSATAFSSSTPPPPRPAPLALSLLSSSSSRSGIITTTRAVQQQQQQRQQHSPYCSTITTAATTTTTTTTTTALSLWSNNNGDEEITDWPTRWKCCFPYLLPIVDGDGLFGQYIYQRIPPLGFLDDLLTQPLVQLFANVPFSGLLLFVALTLGTRFNFDMPRAVRFNAQQAALIDVLLIVPELIGSGFEEGDVPRSLAEPCTNLVYYAYMSAVWYSCYSNLKRGQRPTGIPYVSAYAEVMVGPL
eukprot:CAMPEP_0168744558 /NCGR_PEP_ID=MMETSP0724-20121128/14155_1 /TAXON_ID=265536 /ORGANISM="Amphiprora sp., Strain CCMP467" /LENGTH=262 /DNA_ID=CAMNT_0008792225 /DNA_START=21 /DNA_END=809 /DNA_ORIENTATION=+